MNLKIVFGKAGTGKTQYCFNDVKNKIKENKKIYIITPEQFSYTAEKKLMNIIENDSVLNAEVLTFERMAYRVLNEIGGVNQVNLTNCGKSMMIYNILHKNNKKINFLNKSDENIEIVSNSITELKKHNVTVEDLKNQINNIQDEYLKIKLEDIILIYEKYNLFIENNYIDENDLLTILSKKLKYTHEYDNAEIFIDEFAGFTHQEYSIISNLLDVANITISICTDNLKQSLNPDIDVFYDNKKTIQKILDIAKEKNIKVETVNLEKNYRFKNNELIHIEKNLYSVPYNTYNKNLENINIFLSNNQYTEIEYVAEKIIKIVQEEKCTFNDFAIITKNLDTYSSLIKIIFSKYKIPFFMDENKDLNQNMVIKYVLSLLDIINKNWSYESVFNYLKMNFLDIDNEELFKLENYCVNWGIKGDKWYKEDWKYGINNDEDEKFVNRLNEIRKTIINPIKELKDQILKERNAENICKNIYDYLIKNNIDKILYEKAKKIEELGLIEISKEYILGWNILMKVLDEIVLVFKNEKLSIDQFITIFKIGIKNSELGKIPATQDQVIIGDVDRSRSHNVKYVFIIGLNDGIFPSINKNEGFINDKDREKLKENGIEIAKTTLEKIYEDNFNIYRAFTIPEEKLYLSYASSDIEGKTLRPSIIISKIKKIFPKIQEKSDILEKNNEIISKETTFEKLLNNINLYLEGKQIDDVWFEIYKFYSSKEEWNKKITNSIKGINYTNNPEKIDKNLISKLYGNTLKTSISQLEKYKSCPFSFHLKYGLNIKDKKTFKIDSIDTGTFMHNVIDTFFNTLLEKQIKPKEIEESDLNNIIDEIIEDKLNLSKNYIFTCNAKFRVQTNRLKRVIKQSIKYIIEEMKTSDFEIVGNEVEFKENAKYKPIIIELENGKKAEIIGKIDRIDIGKNADGNYVRIIDYKSSIKDINLNEVVAGIQIQLLTYLDATCKAEDLLPAGVLYYNLIDKNINAKKRMTDEEIEQEIKKQFKMQGLILADLKVIKMMDKTLEKGSSAIVPAGIDTKGNLKQNKSIINKEDFEKLQKYTKKIIKDISKDILSGNIELKPYYKTSNKKTACEYCEYKSICQFNKGFCGNNYNYIYNLDNETIFNKI